MNNSKAIESIISNIKNELSDSITKSHMFRLQENIILSEKDFTWCIIRKMHRDINLDFNYMIKIKEEFKENSNMYYIKFIESIKA